MSASQIGCIVAAGVSIFAAGAFGATPTNEDDRAAYGSAMCLCLILALGLICAALTGCAHPYAGPQERQPHQQAEVWKRMSGVKKK